MVANGFRSARPNNNHYRRVSQMNKRLTKHRREYLIRYTTRQRRNFKEILVAESGGVCLDCTRKYPPFMFDFDHRDSATKVMALSQSRTRSLKKLRDEAKKCDLVCSNCHRLRTHKRRCLGCLYCI